MVATEGMGGDPPGEGDTLVAIVPQAGALAGLAALGEEEVVDHHLLDLVQHLVRSLSLMAIGLCMYILVGEACIT